MCVSYLSPYLFLAVFVIVLSFLPRYGRRGLEGNDKKEFFRSICLILAFTSTSLLLVRVFPNLSSVLVSAVLVFWIGFYSQGYRVPRSLKLFLLSGIAIYLAREGVCIHFLSSLTGGYYYLSFLAIPLTVLWIVGISNSLVILDEVEGASLGVSLIASTVFGLVAYMQHQGLWDAIALSSLTAIFCAVLIVVKGGRRLGEGFSSMLGFLLATVAILGVLKRTAFLTLLIPIMILGVPLLNSSYAVVSGYIHPLASTFSDRKKRLYHHLLAMGLGEREIAFLIHILSLYLGIGALLLFKFPSVYIALFIPLGALFLIRGYTRFFSGTFSSVAEQGMRRRILGIRVDNISLEYALGRIEAFLRDGETHMIITPDSPAILTALEDEEYRKILDEADMVVPDGIGIVIAGRLLGQPISGRLPGIELMGAILRRASFHGRRVFLVGAKKGVAKRAAFNMKRAFPGIEIVGVSDGYFDKRGEKELIERIRRSRPHYLFVGMGVPKQEKWMYRNRHLLRVPVMMGVGGSFDVWAGDIKRAPLLLRKIGLEWLYRAILEPWRIRKILKLYRFALLLIINLLKGSGESEN